MYSAGIMSFDYIELTCASSVEGRSHTGTCKGAGASVRIRNKPAPVEGPANKKPILTAANETDSGGAAILHSGSSNQPNASLLFVWTWSLNYGVSQEGDSAVL